MVFYMHIGSKIDFKETININNSNFISLLDDNSLKIYNKVLDMIDNELNNCKNVMIIMKKMNLFRILL